MKLVSALVFNQGLSQFSGNLRGRPVGRSFARDHQHVFGGNDFTAELPEALSQQPLDAVAHDRVSNFGADRDSKPTLSLAVWSRDDHETGSVHLLPPARQVQEFTSFPQPDIFGEIGPAGVRRRR
ncbi:MAG TPA: hypothetical protein VNO43_11790 [Candidatus Eisenbacteria bacterium]|nr:hypothetical protein [Candidatus Eisenbacteria bacterium]